MVSITVVSELLSSKLKIEITIAGCFLQWEKCLVPTVPAGCTLLALVLLSFFLPYSMHIISITVVTLMGRNYYVETENCSFDSSQQIVIAIMVSTLSKHCWWRKALTLK